MESSPSVMPLHGGNNHDDICRRRGIPDKAGGVEHAFGAQQRAATKLKGEDFAFGGSPYFRESDANTAANRCVGKQFFRLCFRSHGDGSGFCSWPTVWKRL
jgi:hypothetical protein